MMPREICDHYVLAICAGKKIRQERVLLAKLRVPYKKILQKTILQKKS